MLDDKYTLFNMTVKDLSMDQICKRRKPGHVLTPVKMNYSRFLRTCAQWNGQAQAVTSKEVHDAYSDLANDADTCRINQGTTQVY